MMLCIVVYLFSLCVTDCWCGNDAVSVRPAATTHPACRACRLCCSAGTASHLRKTPDHGNCLS